MANYVSKSHGHATSGLNRADVTPTFTLNGSTLNMDYNGNTYPVPPIPYDVGYIEFFRVPNGSRNVHFKVWDYCSAHNSVIQVFHERGGRLLVGTPVSLAVYRNGVGESTLDKQVMPSSGESFDNYVQRVYAEHGSCMWFSRGISDGTLASAYRILHGKTLLGAVMDARSDTATWSGIDATDPTAVPTGFESDIRTILSKWLCTLYPSVFPANFVFDDREVNGTGKLFLKTSNTLTTFTVDGETIKWTGNARAGISVASRSGSEDNTNYEELSIDQVYCTILVGVMSTHFFKWEASWEERTDPDSDPCYATYGDDYGGGETDPPEPKAYTCFSKDYKADWLAWKASHGYPVGLQ